MKFDLIDQNNSLGQITMRYLQRTVLEFDSDFEKVTKIENCMGVDRFENEVNCKKCGNFICVDVVTWLVPKELRHMLCTISDGKDYGFRCHDCHSKWDWYNPQEGYGVDIPDDEIDIVGTVQDISCEYCHTHCGFFLERIQSKEEQELNQEMFESKQRRRLPHMTDLERRYDQKPHLENIMVCRNCRNYLN